MCVIRVAMAAILLLLTENCLYANSLTEAEIKARDYSVEGATFGMSLSDFESRFSVKKPLIVDPSNHIVTHEIVASDEGFVQFEFYRGHLSAISRILSFEEYDDRVERETAVEEQTIKTFGKPHHSSDGDIRWSFPKVNRSAACGRSRGNITVRVRDTSTRE